MLPMFFRCVLCQGCQEIVYPKDAIPATPAPSGEKAAFRKGLKETQLPVPKDRPDDRVRIVTPFRRVRERRGDPALGDSSGSELDHSSRGSVEVGESSDDSEDPGPAEPARLAEPGVSIPWGRPHWRIASLRGGGWGAVCSYHHFCGYDSRKCQKSVRDSRFSDEVQRRLMKQWLIRGLSVDELSPVGQHDHVHGVDIFDLLVDLPAEADLDAFAATLI